MRSSGFRTGRRVSRVVNVLLIALLGAGCGSSSDTGGADVDDSTTTSAIVTTVPSTPPPSVEEEVFGWLRSFESQAGVTTIGVDKAEMLTGAEALAAARKEGSIGPDEELPGDFYISNPDESLAMFAVSPDVVVTLQACFEQGACVTTERVDLDTWSILLGGEEEPGLPWSWYGAGGLPYVFTVFDDTVIEVAEFYLP